jgi:glucose/mannose-6-phosphate isomerase
MSSLDSRELRSSLDPKSMGSLIETFPSQIQSAMKMIQGLDLGARPEISNIVVTGLGGSAIGGDVVRSAAGFIEVPLLVNRDYSLPRFVGPSTLVLACSYSGGTEETLSAYAEAKQARASIVCITSGGRLAQLAKSDEYPIIALPGGLPPRSALGYSTVALLGVLGAFDLMQNIGETLRETVDVLASLRQRYGLETPEADNQAKSIARSLHGKIIAIYGSNGILDSAALRWRGQIEENAKNLALHHVLPEMNHNELVGWQFPAQVLKSLGVVFLRDRMDHPQVQRRFELTEEIVKTRAGVVREVWSEGNSPLARIFSVIYLGDFVSLYLAYLNEIDPTPVQVIEILKQKLSLPAGG